MGQLQKKSQWLFLHLLVFAGIFFVGIVSAMHLIAPTSLLAWRSLLDNLQLICGCDKTLSFSTSPFLYTFILAGGLLLLIVLLYFFFVTATTLLNTRRFIVHHLHSGRKKRASLKLQRVVQRLKLSGRVIEIQRHNPIVFCFGFFSPRICISSGLVHLLTEEELTAVLRHEKMHMRDFGPLKIFISKVLKKSMFFIPGIRSLSSEYLVLTELAADEYATKGFQEKTHLARALSKILDWHEGEKSNSYIALSFFSASIRRRVEVLFGERHPSQKIILSLCTGLLGVAFFFVAFSPFLLTRQQWLDASESTMCEGGNFSNDGCFLQENQCFSPVTNHTQAFLCESGE